MRRFLSAVVLAACSVSSLRAAAPKADPLPFLQDDYPQALSRARARKLPIFAEAWAPW
jgi:endonuclease YncB( thermonuclease family)